MPRVDPGGGGGSGSTPAPSISVPASGIILAGPVELVAGSGVVLTVYPEQGRIVISPGFSDEVWGDVMFRGTAGWQRLAAGAAGTKLTTQGPNADPTWT